MPKEKNECFVIMPIGEPDKYEKGHFQHVYKDIVSKACELAGYQPIRADDILETNLIHLDVLKRIIETPMAICDLSSQNPNVLFELGLRQAFDKPVVLIQEKGAPAIFDIAPLRYTEYRKERIYHHVLEDQQSIADAITATKKSTDEESSVNSMIKLLSLASSAKLKDMHQDGSSPMMQVLMAEIEALRRDFRRSRMDADKGRYTGHDLRYEIESLQDMIDKVEHIIHNEKDDKGLLNHAKILCDKCWDKSNYLMRSTSVRGGYRRETEMLYERISDLRKQVSILFDASNSDADF